MGINMINILLDKFDHWTFKRIVERAIVQGPSHANNIQKMYQIIHNVARNEFTEDNNFTLDGFLRELFENTQPTPPSVAERVVIKEVERKHYIHNPCRRYKQRRQYRRRS